MLELRRNDITIPIPPDLEVNREFETTIFNRDPEVYDFTLPIELPLTEDLIRALDMPHVLANPNVKQEYDFELIIDGIYVNKVLLKVLRTRLKQKTCSVSIIGNYGSFSRLVGEKRVNELTLGGIRLMPYTHSGPIDYFASYGYGFSGYLYYEFFDPRNYMKDVNKGNIPSDFYFPSCTDEKIHLETGHTTLKDDEPVRSLINAYDFQLDNFVDPVIHYLNSIYSTKFWSSERHYWVPMFKLSFVLKKCFEEFGFTVSGNALASLEKTLLYNTFAINRTRLDGTWYPGPYNPNYVPNTFITLKNAAYLINPQNHVPRWKIADFITEVSKNFNLQFLINNTDKTVQILQLGVVGGAQKDLSAIAFPDPEISFEKIDFQNGYKLEFEWDPEDGESGADIKDDIHTYPFRGIVNWPAQLNTIASPQTFDIAYVKNLNSYYQYGGQDWFFYSHALGPYETSDSEQLQSITSKVIPMNMKYLDYSLQKTQTPGNYIKLEVKNSLIGPVSATGMEGESLFAVDLSQLHWGTTGFAGFSQKNPFKTETNRLANATQPHIVHWNGMVNIGLPVFRYPMASSVPFDLNGSTLPGIALAWHIPTQQGLYWSFWKDFITRVANALQVDYKILMDAVTYSNLNLNTDIIVIDHLQYLCRKANIPMPFPSVTTLTLVRI